MKTMTTESDDLKLFMDGIKSMKTLTIRDGCMSISIEELREHIKEKHDARNQK